MAALTRPPAAARLRVVPTFRGALLLALLALLALPGAAPLHAQTLYEWREPGGTVAYSQQPPGPQDGVLLRQIELPTLAPEARRAATRVLAHSSAADAAAPVSLRRADAAVGQAVATLQAAERTLRHGQQPRAGERRHLVNGHSRLTQAYFDRISGLEAAVSRARDALTAAYAARDNLNSTPAPR